MPSRSFLEKEIKQQPSVLESIWKRRQEAEKLARAIARYDPWRVVLVARGSSDHAAVYGKYLIEMQTGIPVSLAAPSIVTRYKKPLDFRKTLVIALSQSGESEDVVSFIKEAARRGGLCLAICNDRQSSLIEESKLYFYLSAGDEKSIAATKTYTAELFALLLLASFWSGSLDIDGRELTSAIAELLEREGELERIARDFSYTDEIVILARGVNTATAMEWGLKLSEVCGLSARGMSGADFLHGPQTLRRKRLPYCLLMPEDPTFPFMKQLAVELPAHDLYLFSDRRISIKKCCFIMPSVHWKLTPLLYVVPGQLLALKLAERSGLDPDKPPFLRKITRTL